MEAPMQLQSIREKLLLSGRGQLLVIFWLPLIASFTSIFSIGFREPSATVGLPVFVGVLSGLVQLIALTWLYSVGMLYYQQVSPEKSSQLPNQSYFRFHLAYVAAVGLGSVVVSSFFGPAFFTSLLESGMFFVYWLFHMYSFIAYVFIFHFIGKSVVLYESQEEATLGSIFSKAVPFWFYIFGVWVVQPKINDLAQQVLDEQGTL